ncbi:MAG: LamG-like jellyroll fold domain-containing protein, partial [Phycisphaerae bacterium]
PGIVWTNKEGCAKVMNLNLTAGTHTVAFESPFPGLPYLTTAFLDPASTLYTNGNLAGSTHITWPTDHVPIAAGQSNIVTVNTGNYGTAAHSLQVQVINDVTAAVVSTVTQSIPASTPAYSFNVTLPTATEGVYDVVTTDVSTGTAAERTIQYVVVGTTATTAPATLSTTLVTTIDPTVTAPTYSSGNSIVTNGGALGSYRESGATGVYEGTGSQGDFFSYQLSGLTVGQAYVLQVSYPDNAQRTFTVSVVQGGSYSNSDAGVASGGPYDVSNQVQTQDIVFWAIRTDPRILVLNWHSGQRAAVSAFTLSTVNTTPGYATFPALNGSAPLNRTNSLYYEEPDRFPAFFGNVPTTNDWNAQLTTADRMAQWSRYVGINQWVQTVDAYGMDMGPGTSAITWGTNPADELGGAGAAPYLGAASSKDVFQKDLIRLELLKAQQYGISYVPELQPGINGYLVQQLDTQFGGDGNPASNVFNKSWVTVSNTGTAGTGPSSSMPYYNVFDSQVRGWVTSLVSQVANRYVDSPALSAVSLRLMGWQFNGMFSVASLNWGYEDSTINQFRAANPGLNMPDYSADGTARFAERYAWLVTNDATNHAKQTWINWRCAQVTAFYQSLTTLLQAIPRPNGGAPLKLMIDAFGPSYDGTMSNTAYANLYDADGYAQMSKESGIDVAALTQISGLIFTNNTSYPPGIRNGNGNNYLTQANYDLAFDPASIPLSAKTVTGGTVASHAFYNEYMENGFTGNIGLSGTDWVVGALNPAGTNYLARYAAAMAAGNLTTIQDGGLGYVIGQPSYLRPFMTEYMSLPNIGMQQLAASGDPVALWYGANTQNNHLDFYLVNQADYAVTVTVTLAGTPSVYRLSSGAAVATSNGSFTVTLQPYQLLAYENIASTAAPTGCTAAPQSSAVVAQLSQQLSFVQGLIPDMGGTSAPGYAQFVTAQTDFAAGKYWGARLALMSHQLLALYESYGVYPSNLFVGITPQTPLAPLYKLTFDGMLTGDAANPYAVGSSGDVSPVAINRLDPTSGTIPQIVASTGPEGGQSLSLSTPASGNAGYFSAASGFTYDPSGVTEEVLVKIAGYDPSIGSAGLITQFGTGGISPTLRLQGSTVDNPAIGFSLAQTGGSVTYTPSISLVDGKWHHIAGVYVDKAGSGNSRVEIWVDGVLMASNTYVEAAGYQAFVQGSYGFGVDAPTAATRRVLNGEIDAAAITAKPLFPGHFMLPASSTPLYKLTFDGMPTGNAANPYVLSSGDLAPVAINRLDPTSGTIPQIIASTGPEGGQSLSLSTPASGNAGYMAAASGFTYDPFGVTAEVLVKINSYDASVGIAGLISQFGTGGISPTLRLQGGTTNNPSILFGLAQTGASVLYTPTTSLVDGKWHHIAGVYVDKAGGGNSRMEIWVDDLLVASTTYVEAPGYQAFVQGSYSFGVDAPTAATRRVLNGEIDAAAITAEPLSPGNFITGNLPSTPTGLNATPASATQINLAWTAPGGAITGYNIYRGTTSGGESGTPLNGSPVTTTSYSDTTAAAGTTY